MAAQKGNKYAKGNKGGRPRKFKESDLPNLGDKMLKWFQQHLDNLSIDKKVPFFEAFGRSVEISDDTIVNYSNQNKEFLAAYKQCKAIQKEVLITGGLQGLFNATAFIFTAKNVTDMRDKQEVEHSGSVSLATLFKESTDDGKENKQ